MNWYVYILRCADGTLYTGSTNHVGRRLAAHQCGKGAKYTRSRLPVELVYQELVLQRGAALRREYEIKQLTKAQKIALINEGGHRMRNANLQTTREEAWSIVDQSAYCVLSMVTPEGTPFALPVNMARIGETLYFHGSQEGRKAEAMRANPQVCVTCVSRQEIHVEGLTTHYASAVAFGTAAEVTEEEELVSAMRAICMRFAPDNPRSHGDFRECRHNLAVWKITVSDITGKSNIKR